MLHLVLVLLSVINIALFTTVAVWALTRWWPRLLPGSRDLALVVVLVSTAFVLGALQRVGLQGVQLGWLSPAFDETLLSTGQLIKSLAVLGLGAWGFQVMRRAADSIASAEHAVMVLADEVPLHQEVSELGLTPRELEVLQVILLGNLSDEAISQQLYISPATAKTHVRNILRKSGMASRQHLKLLRR